MSEPANAGGANGAGADVELNPPNADGALLLVVIDVANGLDAAGVVALNAAPNGFALGVEVGALKPPKLLEANGAAAELPNVDEVAGVAGGGALPNKLVLNGAALLDVGTDTVGALEPKIPAPLEEEAPKIEGVELVVDVGGAVELLKAAAPNGFPVLDEVVNGAAVVTEEVAEPKSGALVAGSTLVELWGVGKVDVAVINGLLDVPDVAELDSFLGAAKGFDVVDGAPKPPNVDEVVG